MRSPPLEETGRGGRGIVLGLYLNYDLCEIRGPREIVAIRREITTNGGKVAQAFVERSSTPQWGSSPESGLMER